jgi:hypothetical protein
VEMPGYFLRQQKQRLKIRKNDGSESFHNDSSFEIRMPNFDVAKNDHVSFESVSFPGFFVCLRKFELWIDLKTVDENFQKSSTFKVSFADQPEDIGDEKKIDENELVDSLKIRKMYRFTSLSFPNHSISVDTFDAFIFQHPGNRTSYWRVIDGLAGRGVSFESIAKPNKYLRCQNSRLKLLPLDGTRLCKEEATFIVRKALADPEAHKDCVSFESVSFTGCFVYQKNFELWIGPEIDESPDFKQGASFKPIWVKEK